MYYNTFSKIIKYEKLQSIYCWGSFCMFNLDKKQENKLTLALVILFAFAITAAIIYLNSTHMRLGHSYRDVYFYLIESLRMSGVNIDGYLYVNYLPPFIPFLTSILFRLGFVGEYSIFITSGIFFFIGIVGLFRILRLRFDNFFSFFGALVYATLLINIKWVGNGTLDIPFVALMIWALYFFIQGMEKNQKYFYIAFPLAVLSFFTKYTGALIVGVMALYFMSRTNIATNIRKYFKNIVGGIIAGIITSIPFFAYFFLNNIPLGFLNQAKEVSTTTSLSGAGGGKLAGNDLFFYIKSLVYNISATDYIIGILILAVVVIGMVLVLFMFKGTITDSYSKIKNTDSRIYKWTVPAKLIYAMLFVSFAMIIISFFTASLFSFVYSEVLLFAGMYMLAYSLTKIIINYEHVDNIWLSTYPFLAINIAMAGLFLSFLIFFSAHLTKADRYFTSMAPGFVFLVTFFIEMLINRIKGYKIKNFDSKYLIPIVIMILMLAGTVQCLSKYSDDPLVVSERHAADWMGDKDGIILSDRGPVYTWYLQKEVNYTHYAENPTFLNRELLNNNATYYIDAGYKHNLSDYSPVKSFGEVTIYQRN